MSTTVAVLEPDTLADSHEDGKEPGTEASKLEFRMEFDPAPTRRPSATHEASWRISCTTVPAAGGETAVAVKGSTKATSMVVPPTSTNIEFGVARTTTPMRDSVKAPEGAGPNGRGLDIDQDPERPHADRVGVDGHGARDVVRHHLERVPGLEEEDVRERDRLGARRGEARTLPRRRGVAVHQRLDAHEHRRGRGDEHVAPDHVPARLQDADHLGGGVGHPRVVELGATAEEVHDVLTGHVGTA